MIRTFEVAGAAYTRKQLEAGAFLTHSHDSETDRPLCKRVKAEHVLVDGCYEGQDAAPTCPVCAKRDPRFK